MPVDEFDNLIGQAMAEAGDASYKVGKFLPARFLSRPNPLKLFIPHRHTSPCEYSPHLSFPKIIRDLGQFSSPVLFSRYVCIGRKPRR